MILTIQLNVLHIEVMVMKLVERNEMIIIQSMVMDAIVIEQVLKQAGCEEEDLRQHKIYESIEQQDIIKTVQSILNIVLKDEEME